MRLINVHTLELETHFNNVPPYAILSHTWDEGEVTFDDWRDIEAAKQLRGFAKIQSACEMTEEYNLSYLWVDTNCIDKRSSSELSEAINSMFRWYRDSTVCFAYLADVPSSSEESVFLPGSKFSQSRWFKRGWTLQELLAPQVVEFFSANWAPLTSKEKAATLISNITKVDYQLLLSPTLINDIRRYGIAERMSWSADRETTRSEDRAYSLMGLFNVNLPLLYGEGDESAFFRLQIEIMKYSWDQSILAWNCSSDLGIRKSDAAVSALSLGTNGFIKSLKHNEDRMTQFSITNIGLAIPLQLIDTLSQGFCFAALDVFNATGRAWIPLSGRLGIFHRLNFPSPTVIVSHPESSTLLRTWYPESSTLLGELYQPYLDAKRSDYSLRSRTDCIIRLERPFMSSYDAFEFPTVFPTVSLAFLITFPRGMAGYRLHHAFPDKSICFERSLLIPRYVHTSLWAGLVFKSKDPEPAYGTQFITFLLGQKSETAVCNIISCVSWTPATLDDIAWSKQYKVGYHKGIVDGPQAVFMDDVEKHFGQQRLILTQIIFDYDKAVQREGSAENERSASDTANIQLIGDSVLLGCHKHPGIGGLS